jgi:copper chaperone CopZ
MTATNTTTFSVPDIRCGGCANNIRTILARQEGVTGVIADPATKEVSVAYDPARTTEEAIARVLATAGYPAAGAKGGSR